MGEALQRLDRQYPIRDYRYVGFGSIYFGDFSLFHRLLGISDMVSIEGNEDDEDRVRFNAPYSCIDVKMGLSNAKLPEIPLAEKRWVLWLDYDFCIDATVLKDVKYAATQAIPGSVLAVTLDADFKGLNDYPTWAPDEDLEDFQKKNPAQKLAYKLQRDVLPSVETQGDRLAETYRRFLLDEIGAGTASNYDNPHLSIHQFLNFRYADGREMMTLAILFLEEGSGISVDRFNFSGLRFCRTESDTFRINAPKLTPLEIRRLNQELPTPMQSSVPISEGDRSQYREVYRYFPAFAEMEL